MEQVAYDDWGKSWHIAPSADTNADVHPWAIIRAFPKLFIVNGTPCELRAVGHEGLYGLPATPNAFACDKLGRNAEKWDLATCNYQNDEYMSVYVRTPLQYNCNTQFVIYCK